MHVDAKLVPLALEARERLKGMKDARPSEVMRVKEEFSDRWGGSRGAVLTRALCRSAKLVHVPGLSRRPNPNGNLIVHGENLAALKALRSQHQSVKCCYIDPPYNNRERHGRRSAQIRPSVHRD